jgi:hypothetical protein
MPHGGTVEVDLRPPLHGFLEIYVRDTGPGIAAAPPNAPNNFCAPCAAKMTPAITLTASKDRSTARL